MIKKVKVINYLGESVEINLTDGDPEHGMIIQSITGLGPPKANINMTDLTTMDGSLFNSARAEKRNIVIDLLLTFAPTIEDSRQRTYRYFPIKKPVTLIIETDNRIVETTGYVESNEPNIFSKDETVQISIMCEDSYFYSAEKGGTNIVTFSGVIPMFEFPFNNESTTDNLLEMGTIRRETEKVVTYEGEVETGIVIEIHAVGNVGNISIYNTTTRESMKIDAGKIATYTGSGIIYGDVIRICTKKGQKYITLERDGKIISILNCLGTDADWFQIVTGDNIFAYRAETGIENIQFTIEYTDMYEGV